jgi:hypothetical protein
VELRGTLARGLLGPVEREIIAIAVGVETAAPTASPPTRRSR